MTSSTIYHHRRAELEARIEYLIALLDAFDGDPDIEANGDEQDMAMPEGWKPSARTNGQTLILEDDEDVADDEDGGDTELNGDERDWSCADDVSYFSETGDGSGVAIANGMIRGLPSAQTRARAYADAGPSPIVYDLRRTRR